MGLEIIEIYKNHSYSFQYKNVWGNEFDRLFTEWNQTDKLVQFMQENEPYLSNKEIWGTILSVEDAAKRARDEANELEDLFEELNENTQNGKTPDYDTHFKYLNGKYFYELELIPMKSYGPYRPSMLRIYAIKLESNLYIITGGGIKLADSIQNSPGLKEHIIKNIDKALQFLKENNICDLEDLQRYITEQIHQKQ